jgi:hypothetical protein
VSVSVNKYDYDVSEAERQGGINWNIQFGCQGKINTAGGNQNTLPTLHTFPLLTAVTNPKWETL